MQVADYLLIKDLYGWRTYFFQNTSQNKKEEILRVPMAIYSKGFVILVLYYLLICSCISKLGIFLIKEFWIEIVFPDFAFGRCLSPSDFQNDDFIYQYPTYSPRAETLLEEEMSRLYYNGYTWKDEYTQCIMQTALAAIKYE